MSKPSKKTIVLLGPAGGGKATLIGCMLFKYGSIDMLVMQELQKMQMDQNGKYRETTASLRSMNSPLQFYTPKFHITIADSSATTADCTILVIPADPESTQDLSTVGVAKNMIIVINKMDTINWNQEHFKHAIDKLGFDIENVPIIPISARDGDNLLENSAKSPWYTGWKKSSQSGTTLLEAIDASL